jgi:hypothetical protein
MAVLGSQEKRMLNRVFLQDVNNGIGNIGNLAQGRASAQPNNHYEIASYP